MKALQTKIAISHYDHPVDVSGVSTWLHSLVPSLRGGGFDVRLHLSNADDRPGPNINHFESLGVPVRWSKAPRTMLGCVRQCIEWINEDRPDIYMPSCFLPSYYAASIARSFGLRTVGVLHNDDEFTATVIEEFLKKGPVSSFTTVVAVSEHLAATVRALRLPDISCFQVPCGVSIPPKTTTIIPDRFSIAYIGRLAEEQKQISRVTRALCEALARHPRLHAVIVGEGPDRSNVERIIACDPNRERIVMTGRLDNPAVLTLLQGFQAMVLLSDYEGLPVSLLEGMAAGVVPICSRMRSGVEEVLQSGVNGFVVNDRDEGFQTALSRLISEPATWLACSRNARRTVESRFSMEACHRKWVSAIEETAGQPAAALRSYPIPLPTKVPSPHPNFHWRDDPFDRLFPFAVPLRNAIGRWRRRRRQQR